MNFVSCPGLTPRQGWVEVEFGNARSYYQDYVKFMLARRYREARLGLLLCPTNVFAGLLCELGSKRAQQDVVRERAPAYSGMMSFEKAVRELPYLGFMFPKFSFPFKLFL